MGNMSSVLCHLLAVETSVGMYNLCLIVMVSGYGYMFIVLCFMSLQVGQVLCLGDLMWVMLLSCLAFIFFGLLMYVSCILF